MKYHVTADSGLEDTEQEAMAQELRDWIQECSNPALIGDVLEIFYEISR